MTPVRLLVGRVSTAVCGVAAVLAPLPLAGQDEPEPPTITTTQYGIGYAANAPDMMAGGSAYVILPRWGGIGLYVDAKFATSSPTDEVGYQDAMSAQEIENTVEGNEFVRTDSEWWSANAAVVRPISRYFSVYLGGGVSQRTVYALYQVPLESGVGFGSVVWAEDPRAESTTFNLMLGGITRLTSRVSAQFGYETEPGGVTVGLSLRMPKW